MRFFAAPREWNAEVVVDETRRRDRSAASCGGFNTPQSAFRLTSQSQNAAHLFSTALR
jgi:hypothetical protein